jgi:membrane protein YdbS with pleckstrin-like domain
MLVSAPLMLVVLFMTLLVAQWLGPGLWPLSLAAGFLVAGSWVAIPTARWACWTLTLTDSRVILARGVLGSVRTAIPFAAIQTIEVRQSLIGRLLRYGTVEIGPSAGGLVSFGRVPLRDLEEQLLTAVSERNGHRGPGPRADGRRAI